MKTKSIIMLVFATLIFQSATSLVFTAESISVLPTSLFAAIVRSNLAESAILFNITGQITTATTFTAAFARTVL